eukprot:TRINITY_DN17828_c0_g1_i1.p1 TRINITY_DN17828_c0_g1~~TRINITY_DN17828_c0_g1_i1.p1  ORF type:complete len:387 (+),score=57.29 TRINITY_DN17828_c0_g1_i1:35-1162(+)
MYDLDAFITRAAGITQALHCAVDSDDMDEVERLVSQRRALQKERQFAEQTASELAANIRVHRASTAPRTPLPPMTVVHGLHWPTDVRVQLATRGDSEVLTQVYVCEEGGHAVRCFSLSLEGLPQVGEGSATVVAGGHGQGSRTDQLSRPHGIHVTPYPELSVLVADSANHRIVLWQAGAPEGNVVAGGNGKGCGMAQLNFPVRVWCSPSSGAIYVSDRDNGRIVRFPPLADRQAQAVGVAILTAVPVVSGFVILGDRIAVCDLRNSRVVLWPQESDEPAEEALPPAIELVAAGELKQPWCLAPADDGSSWLYVADSLNCRIVRVSADSAARPLMQPVAIGQLAEPLERPVAVCAHLGSLYVADRLGQRVVRLAAL